MCIRARFREWSAWRSATGTRTIGRYASGRGANPLAILAPVWDKSTGALVPAATRVRLARGRPVAREWIQFATRRPSGAKGSSTGRQGDAWNIVGEWRSISTAAPAARPAWWRATPRTTCPLSTPEQAAKGRAAHWIRIDRYYEGEFPDIKVKYMPVLCQQCDDAPCEPVCPVYATYHNPEGLNVQVYNRCVGTFYCANNCPYTVRFFNWFEPEWPEPLGLQHNPDVSVRPAA